MNDNDSVEKTKPTIFYAKQTTKSSRSDKARESKYHGDRNSRDHRNSNNSDRNRRDSNRTDQRSGNRNSSYKNSYKENNDRNRNTSQSSRIETFRAHSNKNPRELNTHTSARFSENISKNNNSPWQKQMREHELPAPIYDEYRQQKKEETLVYSENSCQSVFKHRPTAIVKAFLTQEMAYHFKDLIQWLVSHHLGYDIVTNEQIAKMADTPHHGGICLIVKKRQPLTLSTYLQQHSADKQDHLLAIDDINNPHNLGGIMRTATFYGINGVILRQPALLDSGAAMRVAEGGTEAITPIKSDDLVAELDRLKQADYKIVALLPCPIKSVNAKAINQTVAANKTVFVIFQQINMKLINCADEVVYLKGSDNMAALNISVATGILLSQLSAVK